MVPPMLQQAPSLWRHFSIGGVGPVTPLVDVPPQIVDDGRHIVALLLGRQIVEEQILLLRFALARLGDGRNEVGGSTRVYLLLCGLAGSIQLPMPIRTPVGAVQDRFGEERIVQKLQDTSSGLPLLWQPKVNPFS